GIRDLIVTGVQTCALPISALPHRGAEQQLLSVAHPRRLRGLAAPAAGGLRHERQGPPRPDPWPPPLRTRALARAHRRRHARTRQIGRASCRERVYIAVGAE